MSVQNGFRYSRSAIIGICNRSCSGLPRKLKRALSFLKILVPSCGHDHSQSRPIPVKVSRFRSVLPPTLSPPSRSSLLRICPTVSKKASRRSYNRPPSILVSNTRSIRNKVDEVICCISEHKPDLAVLTETWLNDETDDDFLNISNYSLLRNDRAGPGGGIIAYLSCAFQYTRCMCTNVVNHNHSKTELLWFLLESSCTMIICVYHPYWSSSPYHSIAVDSLVDMLSHMAVQCTR